MIPDKEFRIRVYNIRLGVVYFRISIVSSKSIVEHVEMLIRYNYLRQETPRGFSELFWCAGVLAPRRCSATMQREDETNEQIHSRCPTVTLTSE